MSWLWWIWTSSVACQEAPDAVHGGVGRKPSSVALRRRSRGRRPCPSPSNGHGSQTNFTRTRSRCSTLLSTRETSRRSSQTGSKLSNSRWVHRCAPTRPLEYSSAFSKDTFLQPPELEVRDIGELTTDQFRGIFRLTYSGDAHLVLRTKVQVRTTTHNSTSVI